MNEKTVVLVVRNGFPYLLLNGKSYRLTDVEAMFQRYREAQTDYSLAEEHAAAARDRWERGAQLVAAFETGPLVERPARNSGDRG